KDVDASDKRGHDASMIGGVSLTAKEKPRRSGARVSHWFITASASALILPADWPAVVVASAAAGCRSSAAGCRSGAACYPDCRSPRADWLAAAASFPGRWWRAGSQSGLALRPRSEERRV